LNDGLKLFLWVAIAGALAMIGSRIMGRVEGAATRHLP
jgi:hypothetical protein